MKRALVVTVLLGLSSQAHADKRVWRGVFAGSVAVAVGGGVLYWHSGNEIDEARDALCAGGAYHAQDPSCPSTGSLTQAEVERLNDQGNRAETLSYVGAGAFVVGAGFAGYAFYKGFIADDEDEPAVVVAPSVSATGAGATLQLRW